jgi:competence protein ComFC
MRHKLEGSWRAGFATDLHTVASTYVGVNEYGHDVWDNTRSEMGELVHRLKNRNDKTVIPKIIELLNALGGIEKFDAIIPAPSSNKNRPFQPVDEISKALGEQRGVPVLIGLLIKADGAQLKNVDDPEERQKILEENISAVINTNIVGKNVLLVDDLYRSGATLNACCKVLLETVKVGSVSVLTMTKTRTKR